jgi:c-di-GMP-binding flagellar brake protein YcgR
MAARVDLGDELELRLLGGGLPRPIYVRCAVDPLEARDGTTMEVLSTVRFRLLEFSQAYARLLSQSSDPEPSESKRPHERQIVRHQGEREWLADIAAEPQTPRPTRAPRPPSALTWEEYEPLTERAGIPLFENDSLAPEAFVIDDGELDDIVQILSELGVKTERPADPSRVMQVNWVPPRRLLVVSAKRAMQMRVPLDGDFVSVVVGDSEARMVSSSLRPLGFDYSISRPVHPSAMSMLFQQAIFDEGNQRLAPRVVLGCPVWWRKGWSPGKPGILLDLSPSGCQLMVEEATEEGCQIRIRIPRMISKGHFTLKGRVMRTTSAGRTARLGVVFDSLSAKARDEVQMLLTRSSPIRISENPAILEEDRQGDETPARSEDVPDRRKEVRAVLHQEIVALEAESLQPRYTFVGRDLSLNGIRVEPHPSLELDEALCLALYEEAGEAPLIISAVATRNDGRAGWLLRFVDVCPEIRARLERVLDALPPISRIGGTDSEPPRLVLGQLLNSSHAADNDKPK